MELQRPSSFPDGISKRLPPTRAPQRSICLASQSNHKWDLSPNFSFSLCSLPSALSLYFCLCLSLSVCLCLSPPRPEIKPIKFSGVQTGHIRRDCWQKRLPVLYCSLHADGTWTDWTLDWTCRLDTPRHSAGHLGTGHKNRTLGYWTGQSGSGRV